MCVYVRVCVGAYACVRACVRAWVWVRVYVKDLHARYAQPVK